MRKTRLILFALLLLFVIPNVSALIWSNTTFNNSLGMEILTFTGNQNITRWLSVPSSVNVLTSGFLNLSGIEDLGYEQSFNGGGFFVTGTNTRVAQRLNIPNLTIDKVSFRQYGAGTGNIQYRIRNVSNDAIVESCNAGAISGGWVECDFTNTLINQEVYVTLEKDGASTGSWGGAWSDSSDVYGGRYGYNTTDWRNFTDNDDMAINITFLEEPFPNDITLNIENTNVFSYTERFNQTNNRTSNLASTINKYLNATYLVGSNYLIPFIFHSDTAGILQYLNMLFSNEGFLENSQTYTSSTYDTMIENFNLNITFDSTRYSSVSASINYNGTSYLASTSDTGDTRVYSKNLEIPVVNSPQNHSFYWIISMTDADGYAQINSTFQNQTVNPSNFSYCTSGNPAVNFSIKDGKTKALLSSNDFDINIKWKLNDSSTVFKSNSLSLSDLSNYTFCINTNKTFFTELAITLSSSGYATRNFFFDTQYINITTEQTLYLLNSSDARDIIVIVKDAGLTPLEDYRIKIYRYYESTGVYELVESDKTDVFGQIVASLEENDVKYKFEFYDPSNTLVKTLPNVIVACRSTICIQQFIIEDTTNPFGYEVGEDEYSWTFSFDNNTNIFTFSWVDNKDLSSVHRLEVTRNSLLNGTTYVCNTTSTLDSGVLSCSVGSDRNSYTASAFRTSGGTEKRVDLLRTEVGNLSATFGLEGLFWSLILLMVMAFVGIYYPPVGIILYMVGIFMLGLFDLVYIPPALIIAEIVLGVLFILSFKT